MRIFITQSCIAGDSIVVPPQDSVHIAKVLRMRRGDELIACDDGGKEHFCCITQVSERQVCAQIIRTAEVTCEPSAHVTVFAGIAKGDRFDYLIQKCVEVGASSIVPFVSERCVARPAVADYDKKRERFARIALEASKQSMRGIAVQVQPIVTFEQAVRQSLLCDCSMLLYEKENKNSLSGILKNSRRDGSFAVLTGPEGGFEAEEADFAIQNGVQSVSIGPRILRCETAPVAAVCAIMYHTENFDI